MPKDNQMFIFQYTSPKFQLITFFFQKHKFMRTFHQRKILCPWLCSVFALAFIFCKNVKEKGIPRQLNQRGKSIIATIVNCILHNKIFAWNCQGNHHWANYFLPSLISLLMEMFLSTKVAKGEQKEAQIINCSVNPRLIKVNVVEEGENDEENKRET